MARLGDRLQPRTHRGKEWFPGLTITYVLGPGLRWIMILTYSLVERCFCSYLGHSGSLCNVIWSFLSEFIYIGDSITNVGTKRAPVCAFVHWVPRLDQFRWFFFPWDPCCQNIDILKLYSSKIHNKLCSKKLARVEIQLDKLFKTRPKRIEWVATHVFSVALPSPSLRHWFKCWRRWLKRPTAPGLSPRCVSLEPVSCIGMIRLDNIRA